jgi:radical SAM superfamily enzyme YgiQ (UPF0313 family)
VPGLLCRGLDGRALATEARAPINLKKCNILPDWSICDIEAYFRHIGCRVLHFLGSWGCPNRCHYCNSTIRGYRIRAVTGGGRETRHP